MVLPGVFSSRVHTVVEAYGLSEEAQKAITAHARARKDLLIEDTNWLHGENEGVSVFFEQQVSFGDATCGIFGNGFPVGPRHLRVRMHPDHSPADLLALTQIHNEGNRCNKITGFYHHASSQLLTPQVWEPRPVFLCREEPGVSGIYGFPRRWSLADRKTALKEVAEDLISGEVWLGAISGEQYKSRNWVFFRARLDRADLDEVGRELAPLGLRFARDAPEHRRLEFRPGKAPKAGKVKWGR